jgi:short-subunit dehydrogenase
MGRKPVVVITGASAGIGRATALRFARQQWRVVLIARSESGVHSAQAEIENLGGEAMAFALDVREASALRAAAQKAVQRWGAIDVWINNAMVTMFAPVSQTSPEEYRHITEVTYLGYVYGTMTALEYMRPANKRLIIQVGSALSYRAIPLQAAYCGAKFAIRGFTDSLRSELIHDKSGVSLTMIQLPAVNTPQFDWARNRLAKKPRPMSPVFEPEAIADIIYRAVEKPVREIWVGLPVLKVIAGTIFMPAWLDRYLARSGYEGQLSTERTVLEPIDNLFASAPFGHVTRRRFSREAKKHVASFNPRLLRLIVMLSVTLFLALAAAWILRG